jgi:fimbrial chaperone protein
MSRIVTVILLLVAIGILLLAPARAAEAPGSILIWPVNPVIEGEDRAGALWLENPGKTPVTLQVAIYAWAQPEGKNAYAPQQDVAASPPIVTIEPGSRQLIRLTRMVAAPTEIERPYRIVVDEIPVERSDDGQPKPAAAISFRMRYSLPLFAYAKGAGPAAIAKAKNPASAPAPSLSWHIGSTAEGPYIEVCNDGPVHARLTQASFAGQSLSEGLLGYVLPGSSARWPLPAGTGASGAFTASVNGAPATPLARAAQ